TQLVSSDHHFAISGWMVKLRYFDLISSPDQRIYFLISFPLPHPLCSHSHSVSGGLKPLPHNSKHRVRCPHLRSHLLLDQLEVSRTQVEREEKVSLELSEEILQSMEVGMSFKDYVSISAITFSNGRISSLDFHRASSYLVTASDDESIRLYDVTGGTCLKTINSKKYGVDLVCFTSHPTTVIYSSKNGWDESLRLLSLHDNKYLRYFKGHHDRVVSLSLCSRKDCFISGSLDRTVLLWDQRAEKCQGLLHVQGRPAISYDDPGLVFAIAFGGYIRMFDARKYEKGPFEIFSVGGDISDANVVKFSNDGRLMLLTTADGHIHVLDTFRGTLLSTYNVTPVSCNSTLEASFSPEGMFIISEDYKGNTTRAQLRRPGYTCLIISNQLLMIPR
ncbi:Protein ANTHESIS POMOTING FACTOR 1 isoform A, partial [Glycine soja]